MTMLEYKIAGGVTKRLRDTEDNRKLAEKESVNGMYSVVEAEDKPQALTLSERVTALEKVIAPAEYVDGTWYYRGDSVTYAGNVYTCVAPEGVVCVWSPAAFPTYWEKK